MTTQEQLQTDAVAVRLLLAPLSLKPEDSDGKTVRIMHPEGFTGVKVRKDETAFFGAGGYGVNVHGEPWAPPSSRGEDRRARWETRMKAVTEAVEGMYLTYGPKAKPRPPKDEHRPTTWEEADEILNLPYTRDERRKLENNTYLERRGPDAIAVLLHNTDIVTYYSDGRTGLYTGGWFTMTTKDRMNYYLPRHIHVDGKVDTRRTVHHADSWTVFNAATDRKIEFGRREHVTIGVRGGLRLGTE